MERRRRDQAAAGVEDIAELIKTSVTTPLLPPDAGPDAGDPISFDEPVGCCSTGGSPTGPLVLTALVALALVPRRRRR